jgi:hypothetical protein
LETIEKALAATKKAHLQFALNKEILEKLGKV